MRQTRRQYTDDEDIQLRMLVDNHGPCKWDTIAELMPTPRTGRQCRDRYTNYLSPAVRVDEWTREEDTILISKFYELGRQWSKMSVFFEGRTGTALKNRWNYTLCKRSLDEIHKQPLDNSPPSPNYGPNELFALSIQAKLLSELSTNHHILALIRPFLREFHLKIPI
ncbi:Myb-like DNA-binding domain containing protein [Tritrichomonas foetus]|uniref:Myb-like DNA-binding domain containing protein n=1 Tax=Tritrichomonas foetus TaxID=1144522 RepID=A0A1J4JSV6_9EUKA|nr:Myb-like DNA-binding domain containing protein [Tritrichomonas foetus]|eukprot:OHT00357.1 Myb-like DNA-binding domain containing protein [Tritrichomonas foetus]